MIYFDHAAAMPPDSEVAQIASQLLNDEFLVNSESAHQAGRNILHRLDKETERFAFSLIPEWKTPQVIWSSSGSDAFNQLLHALTFPKNSEVCGTVFDHPALTAMLKHSGCKFKNLQPEELLTNCNSNTALITMTHVQSELGTVLAVDELIKQLRELSPKAVILVDTIQSAGKLKLPLLADIITVSGHKLGTLGGAALIVNPQCKAKFNFNQVRQKEYFIGRIEPFQILLFSTIAQRFAQQQCENLAIVTQLNQTVREQIKSLKGVSATVDFEQSSPYILHLRVKERQSAVLARMLSDKGIMVSAGSACQAEAGGPSLALSAMGLKKAAAYEGLRLSFSPNNTLAEVEIFISTLQQILLDY